MTAPTDAHDAHDLMALICPTNTPTPHPEWPHLCNCADCTARADLIDLSGDLWGIPLAEFDALFDPHRPHPAFNRTYLREPLFRWFVSGELPWQDPLASCWPVRLDPDAEPPAEKFELLALIEPRFERSYRRRRPDLRDQSESSYDYSLANFAFATAWNVQEVADLLIAGRREHGDVSRKGLRRDYIERTLINALLAVARRSL